MSLAPEFEMGLWVVSEAQHVGSYAARPEEYINKVTSFFDQTLGSNPASISSNQ